MIGATARLAAHHPQRADDTVEISAEKGYLREFGNIVFHFSLLGLLVAVAVGKLFGYEGNVIVIADGGPGFCSASPAAFDSFRAGNTVDGTSLYPICLRVNDFQAHYLPTGQAAVVRRQHRLPGRRRPEHRHVAAVPPRGQRPAAGRRRPGLPAGPRLRADVHRHLPRRADPHPDLQWRPDDPITLLSSGVMRFDPPGGTYPDADERRKNQIAIQGLFAPTEQLDGTLLSSSFPALNDPAVAVDIYRGDTGLDTGRPQSLFSLDPRLIDQRRLTKEARVNLRAGEQTRLDDGTHGAVRRRGAVHQRAGLPRPGPGVGAGVRADDDGRPAGVAGGAAAPGLGSDRHQRGPGTVSVELGGLARTDNSGWGDEFERLTERLLDGQCGAASGRDVNNQREGSGSRMNTEHIDIGLARYSDWAFTSSVVVLVVALLLLAVELAYSRSRKVAERELVGRAQASAPSAPTAPRPGVVVDAPRAHRRRAGRPGRAGPGLRSASGCCWCASCCAAWPPRGCRGATCTSSST